MFSSFINILTVGAEQDVSYASQISLRLSKPSCTSTRPTTSRYLTHSTCLKRILTSPQGGSLHPMLDADRLLKAGYLKLCYGDTATSITEKGEYMKIKYAACSQDCLDLIQPCWVIFSQL